jgi:hypothetical protein
VRLVNACPAPFRDLVAAALNTGARYSELATLTAGDFNPATASVYLRPSKSGRGRHVPLTPEGVGLFKKLATGKTADALLFTRQDGGAWGKNHQVRPLTAACVAAKIAPAVTFHELRHTYASTLARRGVDLLTLSKLLARPCRHAHRVASLRALVRRYATRGRGEAAKLWRRGGDERRGDPTTRIERAWEAFLAAVAEARQVYGSGGATETVQDLLQHARERLEIIDEEIALNGLSGRAGVRGGLEQLRAQLTAVESGVVTRH